MKKLFSLIIVTLISMISYSQTEVEGNQSGTWSGLNSPYLVIGDIVVLDGESLIIEAGVEVNFQGYYTIVVNGALQVTGTESDSVFFTTEDQSTGWGGLTFQTTEVGHLSYCRFEYGKTDASAGYPEMHGGAVRLLNSDAVFSNCVFADNSSIPGEGMGGAVYCINTSETVFESCKFYNNTGYSEGGAIKFTSDFNGEIKNCQFVGNSTSYGGGAIMFYSVFETKVSNCLFANNVTNYANGGAIESLGVSTNFLFFENCTMVGNSASTGSGGAAAFYYAEVDFVNCIVYDNSSAYDDDNVYVDAGGSSATVNYCNLIMPEYNTSGANNIEVNPLFVDVMIGDYHLQITSPCIDAGTDIGLPFLGSAPDMGCFEFDGTTLVDDISSERFCVGPNPTKGKFRVLSDQFVVSQIIIRDISGSIVKVVSGVEYDISDLQPGLYFLEVHTENEIFSAKIMKN